MDLKDQIKKLKAMVLELSLDNLDKELILRDLLILKE